ncbi:F-box/LRR-repeat protein 20-like isoform X1 [Gopherus flavomarginatus]|uniref:F-box/LRR-repeat protein 20-like isoform X1 n=1 Tax=Gopherus flavomarginatus TaxID=286002 RepID=UPI0021CBE946|nr:F-box/LRR-repeat protein 20-like isoform X1 [Gopherus flavomarginatus]XP_050779126.1 F-box/LRR-repeat protein 20-like isoform X1 [Gopherus flavomarginatus]XP_050779127.1 F-box/LRR-repeat protein 20-like isoform X1 [Gopherus flavomarginatus]
MEMQRLPVEVITYILSFLPIADRKEASLVNHTWYFAAQDSLRQENILYNIPATSSSLATIESLARRRVSCVSLTSLDSSTVSRDVIQAVSCHLGPHLQSLCLRGSSLTETSFMHLLLACPCLSSLDLSGCNSLFMSGTLLSKPETIGQAQRALTNLQELNLASLRYLSDLSFNRLTGCAPRLARLSLARCHLTFGFDPYRGSSNYNSSALLSFRNLLRFLKERASSFRALDLSGTSITSPAMRSLVQVEGLCLQELVLQNCRDLSNEAISLLCTHQPHLTALDLTGCSELSDQAALAVSAGLRALQSLCLGKLQRLTDRGFLGIAELRSLQRLDLSECSLVSGSELVKVCSAPELRPNLASLSFAFCCLLRDSSVLSLARSLSPSLRVLDLSSCVSITNVSIQAIASHLPRLTVLRLAWCKELTDWGLLGIEERNHHREKDAGPQFSRNFGNMGFFLPPLQNLEQDPKVLSDSASNESRKQHRASLQALEQLQELDLMACSKLTDCSITKVIRFPALRRLSLSLLPELTDASLVAVARGCQSLERLSMSHCGKLTDKGFIEAASSLRRLQHLVISGCSQLTGQTLEAISRECRQLKSLDVSMCHGISMADIALFQAQLPLQTCVQSRFVGGADLSFTL